MSYVAIWLQACLHWRCAYFQTLSWNDTIFVVDWDILYKLCGSANKWSKGFVLSGKIWWQFFSCKKACSKYHTRSTTTPKYTLPQRLVFMMLDTCNEQLHSSYIISLACLSKARLLKCSRFLCFFFFGGTWFVGSAFLAKTVETGDKNRDDFRRWLKWRM